MLNSRKFNLSVFVVVDLEPISKTSHMIYLMVTEFPKGQREKDEKPNFGNQMKVYWEISPI